MWGISDRRGVGCFVSCSLLLPCGEKTNKKHKKTQKGHKKNTKKPHKRTPNKKQVCPSKKPMLIKRGTDKKGKENKEKG
jgi:hypothetical protein